MPDTQQEAQPLVLACVLTGDDLAARGEVVRSLIASHQKLLELEDGYAFQFPGEPEWIHRVVSFVAEERACCPFFTFELHYEPNLGPIWLHLRGSAEIKALLHDQWLTQLWASELECSRVTQDTEPSVRSVGRVFRPTKTVLNGGQAETMSIQFAHLPLQYRLWVAPLGWTVASVVGLGALLLPASPAVSTWLWVAFFLLAGTLCSSAYVRRCSRFHCYITGPLFLLSAFYLSTVELSLVPFMGNTWFLVVVLGTTALSFLAEMIFGKQVNRCDKRLASH